MKFTLKLLLLLCLVIAAIYAATPLWLPHIISKQLPADWQLQGLQAAYPDWSGINIESLRLKGELQAADLSLSAKNIHFSYRGFQTEIKSITLDVFKHSSKSIDFSSVNLNELSLPIVNLTGRIPELSVAQLRVVLHHPVDQTNGGLIPAQPLVLDFESFKLVPSPDKRFHLSTRVGFEAIPAAPGILNIDLTKDSLKANIQFPADTALTKWLVLSAEQVIGAVEKTTRINAVFNADAANLEWLDSILIHGSGGLVRHAEGKLEAQADFAGSKLQQIEQLSLSSDNLHLLTDSGTVRLKTRLLASREQGIIIARLPVPTFIEYDDVTGGIDQLLRNLFPELQRANRTDVKTSLMIQPDSKFSILPGNKPAIQFAGGVHFGLNANGESVSLKSDELQAVMAAFPKLDSVTAEGQFEIEWKEDVPVNFSSPAGDFSVETLSISADVTSGNGELLSTGQGSFTRMNMARFATSVDQTELQWQALDLLGYSGRFATQTQGFANTFEGETWTGFDFNVSYQLKDGEQVNGSGEVLFDNGPNLPIEFSGNSKTEQWNVSLPPATIKLAQLDSLLSAAQLDLPASLKLLDGYLNLQGAVVVDDKIHATLVLTGHEFDASMKESHAENTEFSFNTQFDEKISANGPISIETIKLAGGIDITGLKAELKVENIDSFSLQGLQAVLFDGQLTFDDLRYSDSRIMDTQAELVQIDLAGLLAFADIDGLDGTGLLDISLPIKNKSDGFAIHNGTFRATGPGYLSYQQEGIDASNIGLQALQNFQYKDLSGTIDYQPGGKYQIAIRLEGNNPELYGGYPVVFNLNINGSVPELFEALFITGSFEEAIIKEIKSQ